MAGRSSTWLLRASIASVTSVGLALGLAGCGAQPVAPVDVAPSRPPPVAPRVDPPQESSMTPEQRAALAPLLEPWGSGWTLAFLEPRYTVAVTETPDEYTLTLTARGASGVFGVRHVGKQGAFSGDGPHVPDGPALEPAQLALADEIVKAAGTIWLVRPDNRTVTVDGSTGLAALLGTTPRQTRLRAGRAVIYTESRADRTLLAVVIDLDARALTEITWHSIPPSNGGLIPAADIAVIDEAMRKHGDFGVYGDVTPGLTAMAQNFTVSLARRGGGYDVGVYPRDGYGHELTFTVDLATRTLQNMAAAHSVGPDH